MPHIVIPTTPATPATSTQAPDLAGFREAQQFLHNAFEGAVTFVVPLAVDDLEFPPDTPFDPETGMPLDPVVEPTGDTATLVAVPAEVVHKTTSQGDETSFGPLGWVEGSGMALILEPLDKEQVEGAVEAIVYGERQRILSFRPDGIQPHIIDRWLVFLEGE